MSISSVPRRWEERLRNELFCVEWDVKPQAGQSTHRPSAPFVQGRIKHLVGPTHERIVLTG